MMKLMPEELRDRLPPLHSTDGDEDPLVQAKYFTPDSSWRWYAIEYDDEDILFGYVVGHYEEYGYFSLKELKAVRGPLGLPIERDITFKPRPLSAVKQQELRRQL